MNTIKDLESQRDALRPGNLSIFHPNATNPIATVPIPIHLDIRAGS